MKYIGAENAEIKLFEKEKPELPTNYLLIKTAYSAISPGTELSMSRNAQDVSFPLGYSASGIVVETGGEDTGFEVGDRVACYGAPYVYHGEYLAVPKTLCAKVPTEVSLSEAALSGIGSIAIHALRQARLQFGEIIVVVGLGIYGQLISQIGKNAGYKVLALNRSQPRATLLEELTGIETFVNHDDLEKRLDELSHGQGADAVFLCAGRGGELTNQSLDWLRKKGQSIIVGDIEPIYDRAKMFSKEIDIKISRAGGPGRYDPVYEKQAIDYPYQYVRWTEGRNVAEFVRLLQEKRIVITPYFGEVIPFENHQLAYEELNQPGASHLTRVLKYES
ncbi:zinc-binding alcohol dehydrogenase [Vagococcus lutrae]|uniref:Zinc-binding alcohol dehydrogenase n=1 Tax=Vagococcus lutrae TaxID=81947 RepID=A0AAE9XCZ6_9ENTE|nr:zinc-binding alcohol dehydrogenase [Vagococcus lutrae]WCG21887.1 zinc-binding alcohol dehydrogenase [Vagococcus lutrae]